MRRLQMVNLMLGKEASLAATRDVEHDHVVSLHHVALYRLLQ